MHKTQCKPVVSTSTSADVTYHHTEQTAKDQGRSVKESVIVFIRPVGNNPPVDSDGFVGENASIDDGVRMRETHLDALSLLREHVGKPNGSILEVLTHDMPVIEGYEYVLQKSWF